MFSEKRQIAPEILKQMIGMDQPKATQNAQEREVANKERLQKQGDHDQKIGNRIDPSQHLYAIPRNP